MTVTVDTSGLSPGVYRATIVLDTNSGRQPFVRLPVQVVVSGYWFGWIGPSTVHRTSHRVDIAGTADDPM